MKLELTEFKRFNDKSPLELFKEGIRADATKYAYGKRLKFILCNVFQDILQGSYEDRARQMTELARNNPEWILDLLLSLSLKLRKRTELPKKDKQYLSPNSIKNYFKPLKKFLDMNNIAVQWKRIYATFPELDTLLNSGRGWEREEIRKMLKHTWNPATRALILTAASSGIRIGGLNLNWGDIRPIYRIDGKLCLEPPENMPKKAEIVCGIITVYRGTSWEYPAFVTPEAFSALAECREQWIRDVGREPEKDEPVFKGIGESFPRRPSIASISQRILKVSKRAGIRGDLPDDRRTHEVPLMNGFRRFWNKTCKNTVSRDSPLASLIKKEYMMGHIGLVKLDRNYFKTNILELAEEYLAISPHLTITYEFLLKEELRQIRCENSENSTDAT